MPRFLLQFLSSRIVVLLQGPNRKVLLLHLGPLVALVLPQESLFLADVREFAQVIISDVLCFLDINSLRRG